MSKLKICIECDHYRKLLPEHSHHCVNPAVNRSRTSLVTGKTERDFSDKTLCEVLRRLRGACGPEGVLFRKKGEEHDDQVLC